MVTAFPAIGPLGGASLLARISSELRPEFSGELIFVDASDPVMGGPVCQAVTCSRVGVLAGMCTNHHQRWVAASGVGCGGLHELQVAHRAGRLRGRDVPPGPP